MGYLQARGEAWDKARMRALVRDNFHCQAHQLDLCAEPCEVTSLRKLVVHHILFRFNGGTHALDNLATVCHQHHADIHPHLRYELPEGRTDISEFDDEWFIAEL